MNRNAIDIKQAIVWHAVQRLNHVLVAVEPSMQAHDVWSMSKARYQYEWEVKRSIQDLRREKDKFKHRNGGMEVSYQSAQYWREMIPNYFSIVVPDAIALDALAYLERTPELQYAGLYSKKGIHLLDVIRKPRLIHKVRAPLKRCSRVARWMSISLCDLMEMTGAFQAEQPSQRPEEER